MNGQSILLKKLWANVFFIENKSNDIIVLFKKPYCINNSIFINLENCQTWFLS